MKMACTDTLSDLFRMKKIKVDFLEEIVLQTNKFRCISLNLSYPWSRHLQPYCSPQASIRTRHINQIPTRKGNLGNSHCKRLLLAEKSSLQSLTVVVSIMVKKSSFMYGVKAKAPQTGWQHLPCSTSFLKATMLPITKCGQS